MPKYKCIVEIEIEAPDSEAAAAQALNWIIHKSNEGVVVEVEDNTGQREMVDL